MAIPKAAVVGWSDGAITALDMAMNYTSRMERVFSHGANVQGNQSIPGTDDPIINSKTGSLTSDEETNGTTYAVDEDNAKARRVVDPYSCQSLSPLPERCGDMMHAVVE